MAFCTASDVENYVQFALSSSLETHLTNNIIPLVEAAIKEYVGYDVEQATQTETFTGDQTNDLFLTHLPVNSITDLTWICKFYIENNKIKTFISQGHEKSENEDWNINEVLENYDKRKLELNNLKK